MFNPISPMNHYSIENPASIYDEEAMTALELAGRTAGKVNEIATRVNEHGEYITEAIEKQDAVIEQMVNVGMPKAVDDAVQEHIQDGDFDNQISDYAGNLSQRVDNLLGSVQVGTASADAELIDIRTTVNNVVYPNAGNAVRSIGSDVNELRRGRFNIKYALDWDMGKGLATNGALHENVSKEYAVAHHRFPKGTKIEYTLYTTVNSGTVAIGTDETPISCLKIGNAVGTPTVGTHIVQDEWETVWFMTDTKKLGDCIIAVSQDKPTGIRWTEGYITEKGAVESSYNVYWYSEPIFLPALHEISLMAQASNTVAVISQCDETGLFQAPIAMGKTANTRNKYTFASAKNCYVRVCTSMQAREGMESTFVNNIELTVKPYETKYRVPTFTIGNGHISATTNNIAGDDVYKYSDVIMLWPGETIRFDATGSAGMWMLSEWGIDRDLEYPYYFIRGIELGDNKYHRIEYTNEKTVPVYVRISSKIVPSGEFNVTTTEEQFKDVKLYFKPIFYKDVEKHPLYGKTLAFIGDSLCAGNHHGPGATWAEILKYKYNMKHLNYGVNGAPVAGTENSPIVTRYNEVESADYIVLIGGANDLRLNVPLADFKTAMHTIIDGLRAKHPEAKLLFLTNMNRYGSTNTIGHKEVDYVDAMLEVCGEKCVPCFDNYRKLGIYFRDDNQSAWTDEGRALGANFYGADDVSYGNKHLSVKCYQWVAPVYEHLLTGL